VRAVQQKHRDVLKNKLVVTQSMATKHTGITIPQQFRWMSTYAKLSGFLRDKNSGTCTLTGKSFGEFIHHFVYDGDNMCMQACNNGETRVIISTGCKKHEKKYQYVWVSITMSPLHKLYQQALPRQWHCSWIKHHYDADCVHD
jgi:hypothetical protein